MAKTANSGSFKKGMTPWNKGIRGYMGANKTSFTHEKIDEIGRKSVGVGRVSGGWSACLTDEKVERRDPRHRGKSYMFRKRMGTARFVLMRAGVKLGPGDVVWHLDRDPSNNAVENLEVITRAEMARRNLLKEKGNN